MRSGVFTISEAGLEAQFTKANITKLNRLAKSTGGKVYHSKEIIGLIDAYVENEDYATLQKTVLKKQALIDWKWLLILLLSLLTIEWFVRKYYGKI